MKIYLVGGAVRDKLLGLPVKERDWVVVGATPEEMLKQGYRQVGKEFPVFLHPRTHEEYALARTERKTHAGYKGFSFIASPDVSLEEDLQRRDLTINAMAETSEGTLIDPYHGKQDLEHQLLRHVSPAFIEDPVRILRVGRFLARYHYLGFHVAEETLTLMRQMVDAGEVDALVAERVWKELERALTEKNPEKFFDVLSACSALGKLFPLLNQSGWGMQALQIAASWSPSPVVRFAALLHDHSDEQKSISALCQRYRVPNEYRELAVLTARHFRTALEIQGLSTEQVLKFLMALDIFRREDRFQHFLTVCQIIAKTHELPFNQDWLINCAQAAKSVDVQTLIAEGKTGNELAVAIQEKRCEHIEIWRKSLL